jgi:MYXO-CTERM domain-containing protein
VNQEARLKHFLWLSFVFFALFAPLGCGQADSTAPATEHAGRSQAALTVIDQPSSDGSIGSFSQNESYGQSFTVPADSILQNFSLTMNMPASVVFRGELYAWTGNAVTGPSLYESAPTSTAGTGVQKITFNTGSIPLVAGGKYVFFATRGIDVSSGTGTWPFSTANPYAGGSMVFTGGPPSNWTNGWAVQTTWDFVFTATFGTPTATTTTVASSKTPSVFGESVTLTATVTAGATGTVTFMDGATSLGTATLNGTGQASLATAALGVGTHSVITAAYGGGGGFASSTSAAITQTVNKSATTTAVTSSVNPTIVGGSTTLTATVTATAPGAGTRTGTATFLDGATVLGTGAVNASGVATLATSALGVGSHTITVSYGGDTNFATSTSPAVTQVVNQDGSSVAETSAPNPSTFGASATFTATVTSTGTGGTPTGNVVFKEGATVLGTSAVNAAGVATFSTPALAGGAHTIDAAYAGDTKHTAATGTVIHTVNVGASTTTVASLTNPSVFGQSVTFKATVTGTGGTATGTVTFSEGGTTLGTGTLAAGAATFSTSALSAGTHAIVATYGGDSNFGISASAALSQVVNKAATSTALVSGSNPSIVGASVTFTATVTATAPGAGTPNGTVNFREGATVLGSGTLSAAGVATFSTSALGVGTHTITADYVTSASFAASTSNNVAQVVNKDGVTATIASSLNPSTFGASVTFTATVTSTGNGGIPTGTVTFKDGATVLGTGTLDATGIATYATTALTGGSHNVSATYAGDTNHAGGSSAALAQVVNGATSATALTSSVNPSVFGQSTTLTATVTSAIAGTRTGTVTFSDGATTLGTAMLNAAGVATFSTSTFSVGTHALSAVYGGDANFATSTSAGLSQVVNKGASATALASSSNPSLIGSNVTFTATVTATAPSTGTPSGTVTFKDGATTLGTGTLSASGIATFATTTLAVGAHPITAEYGGGGNHNGSTSAPLTQNVNAAAAMIALTATPSPSTFGGSVTLTATLTGANGTPTGTIAFTDGTTALGMGTLDASGVATFSTATLTAGMHTLGAAYSGDTIYATGTGSAALVVNKAATTTTLASSLNPSTFGAAVTFTATVASAAKGFTGTVEFFDGTTSLGTSPLAGPTATLSTSALTQTGHAITATYKGDANFATSTSAGVTQQVDAKPAGADAGTDAGADAAAPVDTSAPADTGCGCRIEAPAGSTGGMGALFALAAVAVVAARRRRR